MTDKTNWKEVVLDEFLVITILLGVGIVVVAAKLGPIVVRWATKS